jgi:TetR/AcrR family transcriptional regulator
MAKAAKPGNAKTPALKQPEVPRSIGRPSDPSRSVGREALISAACELLKTMPPNEVSGVKIARHCGADPSLIRYYFKDRLGLLIAAAERLTNEFNPDEVLGSSGDTYQDLFRARVARLLDLDAANPFFHRLMLEELLGSSHRSARDLIDSLCKRGVKAYQDIFDQGIPAGELTATNVEMLFVTIVGICQAVESSHHIVEMAVGRKIPREKFLADYKKFLGDLLLNGVAAR